jgi:hypothetical protein
MKQGKNHVSWNENPPQSAAQVVAEEKARNDTSSDSDGIGSPPRINKTAAVTSSAEYEEMKKKLERLKEEERRVDRYLDFLKEQAAVYNGHQPPTREQAACLPPGVRSVSDHMYVRFKDITAMPVYSSETVIGIRAPTGTALEVPDPDQGMKAGSRRFEMYLSSKGADGPDQKEVNGKGEPINVYLVQPRADQQNKGGRGRQGGFVQETPPSERGPPQSGEHRKLASTEPHSEAPRQLPPPFGQPPHRPGEPPYGYGMPPPNRGGDWGYGPGRPPYASQDRSLRKDAGGPGGPPGLPPPGGPPPYPGGPYADPSWGPPPFAGYGQPPPGYHPPGSRQPRPGSQHSPDSKKHAHPKDRSDREEPRSTSNRAREEYSSSRQYPPHHEGPPGREAGGPPRSDIHASPFRPRTHQYHTSHELGRTASSGGELPPPREGSGPYRPPSPSSQQNLLIMPLQSPNDPGYFPSPSGGGPGFSPPGGPRENVRSGDVQFPMPPLPTRESRDYRDRWRPPHPKMSSSHPDDPSRPHVAPRSRR